MKTLPRTRYTPSIIILIIATTLILMTSCAGLQNQATNTNSIPTSSSTNLPEPTLTHALSSESAMVEKTSSTTVISPEIEPSLAATLEPTAIPLPSSGNWMITANTLSYVKQLTQVKLAPIGTIKGMAWSPDGKLLAASGDSGTVLMNGETLAITRELETQARFNNLSFSADGSRLAAGGNQSTVQVWDANTGKTIQILPLGGQHVALSPDGQRLAAVEDVQELIDTDNPQVKVVIKTYNVDTGKLLNTFSYTSGMPGWFYLYLPQTIGVYFSPDGQKLQVVNDLGDVRMWNVTSGKLLGTSLNQNTRTRFSTGICLASSNTAGTFALACNISYFDPPCEEETPGCTPSIKQRYEIGLWDTQQLKRLRHLVIEEVVKKIYGLVYEPDQMKVGLLYSEQLEFWDTQNATAPERTLANDQIKAWTQADDECQDCQAPLLALNPASTGNILAVAHEGSIELWDLTAVKRLESYENDPRQVTASGLGTLEGYPVLATGLSDGSIKVSKLVDNTPLYEINQAHTQKITHLVVGKDGWLVSASADRSVKVWKPGSTTPEVTYTFENGLAMNPGGNLLVLSATQLAKSPIQAYQVQSGESQIISSAVRALDMALSLDEKWLVLDYAEKSFSLWSVETGDFMRGFSKDGYFKDIAISPDGSLVAATDEIVFNVWDVNTSKIILHKEVEAYSIQFDPSGCLLATGGYDGQISLFDIKTGEMVIQWQAHTGTIADLTFSPDGRLLLSTGFDGSARIWGQDGVLQLPSGSQPALACQLSSPPMTSTPTMPPTATPVVTATATPTPVSYRRPLSLTDPRMVGDDILQLQKRLSELGYTGVGTPDGVFGPKTDQAVRLFQERNQLVVDGVVGPITWNLLFSDEAVPAP